MGCRPFSGTGSLATIRILQGGLGFERQLQQPAKGFQGNITEQLMLLKAKIQVIRHFRVRALETSGLLQLELSL